jgi:hypothetical protein
MTLVSFKDAAEIADRLIALLAREGISPLVGSSYESELLSLTQLLEVAKNPSLIAADRQLTALQIAAGVHDLAAKVLSVADQPEFQRLLPHLRLVAEASIPAATLTQNHTAEYNDDVSRKMAELYFACLAIRFAHDVALDHPTASRGDNPDVMFDIEPSDGSARERWALAIKTISSRNGQTIFDRIREAGRQIDSSRCTAQNGIVLISARDALDYDTLWQSRFEDWQAAAAAIQAQLESIAHLADKDRHSKEWDGVFSGRVVPPVLFLGQALVSLPAAVGTRLPTQIKVLLEWGADRTLHPHGHLVAACLNDAMQSVVWGAPGSMGSMPS